MLLTPEARQRQLAFQVGKRGDSVAAVAQRYRVSRSLVAQWNNVSEQARFKPGQTVTVMVAARAAVQTRARTALPGKAPAAKAPATRTAAAKPAAAAKRSNGKAPVKAAKASTHTAPKLRVAQR